MTKTEFHYIGPGNSSPRFIKTRAVCPDTAPYGQFNIIRALRHLDEYGSDLWFSPPILETNRNHIRVTLVVMRTVELRASATYHYIHDSR